MNISPIRNNVYFKRNYNSSFGNNYNRSDNELENIAKIISLKQKVNEIKDYRQTRLIELTKQQIRIREQMQSEIDRIEREKEELISKTSRQIFNLNSQITFHLGENK